MFGSTPLLAVLRQRMNYEQARQKVLAENVANADTVGYRSRDLTGFDRALSQAGSIGGGVTLAATQPGHIGGTLPGASDPDTRRVETFETKPGGNAVNLEEEMMKVAANQADYQAAVTLYAKSLSFLKIAIGKGA